MNEKIDLSGCSTSQLFEELRSRYRHTVLAYYDGESSCDEAMQRINHSFLHVSAPKRLMRYLMDGLTAGIEAHMSDVGQVKSGGIVHRNPLVRVEDLTRSRDSGRTDGHLLTEGGCTCNLCKAYRDGFLLGGKWR